MEFDTSLPTGAKVGVAGGAVAGVATFLPWFGAEVRAGPADVSTAAAGVETVGGLLVLVVAAAVVAVPFLLEWDRTTVLGVLAGGAVVVLATLARFADLGGVTGARVGLYLALVGGLVVLAGGVVGYSAASSG